MAPVPLSAASEHAFLPLADNLLAGAIVVNVFAILSSIGLLAIVFRVFYLLVRRILGYQISHYRDATFFNTQLGYYAACLLIANTVNSVAGLMGLPFLFQRFLDEGNLCTTQAVIMQFGNIATAYFTVAIGAHTFNSLVLRLRQSAFICVPAIVIGWLLALAISMYPLMANVGKVYGLSGMACGIRPVYNGMMFFFHLFPILLAAALSLIIYTVIFVVLRGSLAVKREDDSYERFVSTLARSMLLFPLAYIVCLVPYGITRSLELRPNFVAPLPVTVLVFVLWFLLGVINALLCLNTHRVLKFAFDVKSSTHSKRQTDMSFGTPKADFKRLASISEESTMNPFVSEKSIVDFKRGSQPFPPLSQTSTRHYFTIKDDDSLHSSRGSSDATAADPYQRNITPVAELNKSLDTVYEDTGSTSHHSHARQGSLSSLPPPPRPLRISPIRARSPAFPTHRSSSSSSSVGTRRSPSIGSVNEHRGHASIGSSYEVDMSVYQNSDGRNRPMLSAVKSNFSSPISSPTTPPSARLRPLLLASVERTGSMVLADHYNRMYPDAEPSYTSR